MKLVLSPSLDPVSVTVNTNVDAPDPFSAAKNLRFLNSSNVNVCPAATATASLANTGSPSPLVVTSEERYTDPRLTASGIAET